MNVVPKPRYLTKTRFKTAIECPTKLYYTDKVKIYSNTKQENDFLMALAQGGFQVGELAKLMYPGGCEIESKVHEEAINETQQRLQQNKVILFEAAIRHESLFIRVDVLRKNGDQIELIEVKAKSFDSTNWFAFRQKTGGNDRGMLPYLQDVAFQRHVMSLAFPHLKIKSFLMLADKSKVCTVDGLNQKFKISQDKDGGSKVQVVPGTTSSTIGESILTCVNVDDLVDEILMGQLVAPGSTGTLAELARSWADSYHRDEKIKPFIGSHCAKCEFRATPNASDLKSGLHECWRETLGWTDEQIEQGTVLDIWNFRRKQDLMNRHVYRLNEVTKEHLKYSEEGQGLSTSQRQWMQVSGKWPGGQEFYLDRDFVAREMADWTFPLHFIDFETARVPIPFFSGQRPYDNIAFQFSHHEVQADGSVAHKSEFLCTTPGVRPNYEFVRALQRALGDCGTVFMWSPHENTTLNAILQELIDDTSPPPDAEQMKAAILDLTVLSKGKLILRKGKRAMVDLCNLAESAFFHPLTSGSSSIKEVLPAVLQSSAYLRDRYSQPIYGSLAGIPSKNFPSQIWWRNSGNGVENPYKLLPPVFSDIPQETVEDMGSENDLAIAEGGAATTAFARLQFDALPKADRNGIEAALLRYCELDTLAMVMIYEAWREWVRPIDLLPYYVYELVDPTNDEVFYIGKGSGNRMFFHSEVGNDPKSLRIKNIKSQGLEVRRTVIGRFETEEEAFAVEAVLIKWVYGFHKLDNLVQGHRERFVRGKQDGSERVIPGIDIPRIIVGLRDGAFTAKQREMIIRNAIYEKLETMREELLQYFESSNLVVSAPDISTPSDPCLAVTGFSTSVQLNIKLQLTGKTVVFGLVPLDRKKLKDFNFAVSNIEVPFAIMNGNSSRRYAAVGKDANYGIAPADVNAIAEKVKKIVDRLSRKPTDKIF